jgi:hypothetical protein
MTTTVQVTRSTMARRVWRFTRHYLEMVAAMLVGMVTLYPLWLLVDAAWTRGIEVELLEMATAMTVPMVLWMRFRGHGVRPTLEMTLAMYAGFVVLFPLLWGGALSEMGVMMTGHVLMPVFMLLAMLARHEEYAGHC